MWRTKISFSLLLCVFLTTIETKADSKACEQKEKNLALLDLAKESISKAKDIQPSCDNDDQDIATNSSECGAKEKVSAYLDIAVNLIDEARRNQSTCDITKNFTKIIVPVDRLAHDCSELTRYNASGVYTIWPRSRIFNRRPIPVYCDMETDGGVWTVIQRRGNFSQKEDFYRDWYFYKIGFGNPEGEYWLGNDNIFALTNLADYTVRFDMERRDGEKSYAEYSSFWIGDEESDYQVHFGNYSGTAGDGSIPTIRGMKFSTKDRRNDIWSKPCTDLKQGGWWYSDCGGSNPNGVNELGANGAKYMNWDVENNTMKYQSLLSIEIKIRATN